MTDPQRTVILGGARTPVGKLLGGLAGFPATALGGVAIRSALERSGLSGGDVDYVIMGQVLAAGGGQATARQAAVAGGVPMNVPAITINKMCLSGLNAAALADLYIRDGAAGTVVAGGMESMTNAPHLLMGSRKGYKYGSVTVLDHMDHDGLTDVFDCCSMGELTDRRNDVLGIGRAEQDEFSAQSHQRAAAAQKNGLFADEIVPVEVPQRRGDPLVVSDDEGIRPDTTAEGLGRLRPSFRPDGTITAGSASQISDGACALVLTSAEQAAQLGAPVLAEVGAHGMVAGPDSTLQSQPSGAIRRALDREGIEVADVDLFEINEAFASVALQSMRDLGVGPDKVNVNGGAIALGHPIGMSGARILLHLAYELRRRGGGTGVAALCGGGGQGDALVIRVPAA
ncbi:MAG: acetyl-CoA C-acetyltransferase [Streptosporangiales bacterium]|nr:acetyl-CoA C-acetyltransferase [Streptosporangiales bacterium]MBO0891743.1 acetyl-CoA C-acetyltransferase [Acidothermales bacterium]